MTTITFPPLVLNNADLSNNNVAGVDAVELFALFKLLFATTFESFESFVDVAVVDDDVLGEPV